MSFYALSCVSLNSIPIAFQSRVRCLTTMPFAGHRRQHDNKNWQWLTEEEKWVIARMPISWCGQWCLAMCSVHHCWQFGVPATEPTVQVVRRTCCCRAMLAEESHTSQLTLKTQNWLWFLLLKYRRKQQLGGEESMKTGLRPESNFLTFILPHKITVIEMCNYKGTTKPNVKTKPQWLNSS